MFLKVKLNGDGGNIGCGCIIFVMIFNLIIGAWSVAEILSWFGKDIPIFADALIGLFVAEISVPIVFIGWILKVCGVF